MFLMGVIRHYTKICRNVFAKQSTKKSKTVFSQFCLITVFGRFSARAVGKGVQKRQKRSNFVFGPVSQALPPLPCIQTSSSQQLLVKQGDIKQTSRLQKNAIKRKNRLRPKNRGKQKPKTKQRPRGCCWTDKNYGPVDSHDELFYRSLCGELQNKIEAPEAKHTSSKAFGQSPSRARGFALRLKWPGDSIEIRGAGGERATGTCLCVARTALFFACVRPPPPKNRKTDRSKKTKKTFYIVRAFWVIFFVFNGNFRQYFQNLHHLFYGFRKY
jgi:hypothetical protein